MAKPKDDCRRKPWCVEKRGNASVPIYRSTSTKGGKQYVAFTVHAYAPDGKRQRWSFADLEEAKAKAGTFADAMAKRQADAENRSHPLFLEAVDALDIVYNAGGFRNLVVPVRLLAEALKLVSKDQLLLACQAWVDRTPGATFIPKKITEALDEFLARQKGQISERRHRTNTSYFKTFKALFENCDVHNVNALELSDKVDSKGWGKRTKNDFLGTVSLFYQDAIRRNYAAINPAGAKAIKRARLSSGSVHIFTVETGADHLAKLLEHGDFPCFQVFPRPVLEELGNPVGQSRYWHRLGSTVAFGQRSLHNCGVQGDVCLL